MHRRIPVNRRSLPIAAALLPIDLGAMAGACAPGQSDSAPLAVDQIIARHLDARGGVEAIRSIETLREKGRITAGAHRQAVVTRERKRPAFARFEFTLQGVTGVFVSNGVHGWKMSPLDGDLEPQPLPDLAVAEAAEQADIEGPLVDWKAKGHRVELAGREAVDGRDAYKVKLTLKSGAVRYEYFDVGSFIQVRSDSTRHVRGLAVDIVTTFSDHRKTDGVLFPHLIEVTASGRPQQTRIVVDAIELNPPLSDDRFAMADGGE